MASADRLRRTGPMRAAARRRAHALGQSLPPAVRSARHRRARGASDQAIMLRCRRTATHRPRPHRTIRARPARSRPRAARRRQDTLSSAPLATLSPRKMGARNKSQRLQTSRDSGPTHSERSGSSEAPRSTQSNGDRFRKPDGTSLTWKRSLGSSPVRSTNFRMYLWPGDPQWKPKRSQKQCGRASPEVEMASFEMMTAV